MMKQIKNRVRQLGVTLTLLALLVTQALAAVPAYLIPGGNTVGIKLYTRGLVVTAVSDGMAAQAAGLAVFAVGVMNGRVITIELWALVALLPIWCYNGRRGYSNRAVQYGFYAFYPVHILILSLIAMYR